MTDSATLTLVRVKAHPNRLRAYRILVDDREIGVVKNGETFSATLAAGRHRVIAKIDWLKSAPLEVTCVAGTTAFVRCQTSGHPIEILNATLGRPSQHLVLSMHDSGVADGTPDGAAAQSDSFAQRMKRAAVWFGACIAVGIVLAVLVDNDEVSPALTARRHFLIGQLTGFIGVLGAMWRFFWGAKSDRPSKTGAGAVNADP